MTLGLILPITSDEGGIFKAALLAAVLPGEAFLFLLRELFFLFFPEFEVLSFSRVVGDLPGEDVVEDGLPFLGERL